MNDKTCHQFVILNKDGTYSFSPNLPLVDQPVVGVFNCKDSISERFDMINGKPVKECVDPVFVGTALYAKREDGSVIKCSRVVGIVKHTKPHRLQIETVNSIYNVTCTSDKTSYAIRTQLRELGFTK